MDFYYENHLGEKIQFYDSPYVLEGHTFLDWALEYTTVSNVSGSFRFVPTVKTFHVLIVPVETYAEDREALYKQLINRFVEVVAKDTEQPGKLWSMSGDYVVCRIVTSNKTDWNKYRKVALTCELLADDPVWIRDNENSFAARGGETSEGEFLDFGVRLESYPELSGTNITFQSNYEMPLKSFIVDCPPQQSGEGTPSDENVRDFTVINRVSVRKSYVNGSQAEDGTSTFTSMPAAGVPNFYGGIYDLVNSRKTYLYRLERIRAVSRKITSINNVYFCDSLAGAIDTGNPDLLSNRFEAGLSVDYLTSNDVRGMAVDGNGNIYIGFGSEGPATVAEANSYLSSTTVNVLFRAASPYIRQSAAQDPILQKVGRDNFTAWIGNYDAAVKTPIEITLVYYNGLRVFAVGDNGDYPYDYMSDQSTQVAVNNSGDGKADYQLTIYGPATDPRVTINNIAVGVDGMTVQSGEYLVIDTAAKTVTLVNTSGEHVNAFNNRIKTGPIFTQLPPGSNTVYWSGDFGFDLTIYERRREAEWI